MNQHSMKVAVVGCGAISDIYIENMISKFSILDVVACCDTKNELAQAKAEKFNLKVLAIEEIIKDESIEIVVNLTPPIKHYSIIKEMLNANKHVYTEKIMTLHVNEAQELVELAEMKQVYLGSAPDTFLGSALQNSKHLLDQGVVGKIVSCHASVNRDLSPWYTPTSFFSHEGGGIGFDVGIYYLTAMLSILGPVDYVTGIVDTLRPERKVKNPLLPSFGKELKIENETLMIGTLKFKNNVYASIHFNSESIWPEQPQLIFYGTEGILQLADPNSFGGEILLQKKGAEKLVGIPSNFGFSENSRGLGVAEMAWSIKKGRPNRASSNMQVHAIEVLNGIVQSSKTKQFVIINSSFEIPRPLPEGYLDDYYGNNPESALIT